LQAVVLVASYVTLLRFDLTMVPAALGVMAAVTVLVRGLGQPYPGALPGGILGALLVTVLAALWFRALRRAAPPAVAPAI